MKTCNTCHIEKEDSEFYRLKRRGKYILDSYCKQCDYIRNRKYKKANKEKVASWSRAYRENNPWVKTLLRIKTRLNNPSHNYHKRGIKNYLTIEDLKILWFRDKAYELEQPSIDRLDSKGNYTFENCRYIEMEENNKRPRYHK